MRSRRGPSPNQYAASPGINNAQQKLESRLEYNPLSQYEFDDGDDGNHNLINSPTYVVDINNNSSSNNILSPPHAKSRCGYRIYRARWLMLFYLSLLNLLSDWAGLSVAPIATITSRAYNSEDGEGDSGYYNNQQQYHKATTYILPETLVTIFLVASCVGTALEPWILSRLGLRRTIVFGAFCNMVGSLVKSGGLPPITALTVPSFHHGMYGKFALYVGFFLVGFAQPLFQCTPALLSASWFPEEERTLATSIALNSNQIGVGCAFIVGALWVQSPSQIVNYFSLLSFFSILVFVGTALQLDDAPPTPPSGSSRIMRGTLEVSIRDIIQRASSSLLVDSSDHRQRYFEDKFRSYRDDDVFTRKERTAACSAVDASAQSLLRQHVIQHKGSAAASPSRDILGQYNLAAPYSTDEGSVYDECDGAEPTVTQTPHHLEIDIRDDQIILAAKACFARKGFSHALVVFTVCGIVINTLSTYLDYLVRGDYYEDEANNMNASNEVSGKVSDASKYVALIGALFQVIIMASSVLIGAFTDKFRSYYVITLVLLVLGAFALAECGVSLAEDRGVSVRWTLLLVSALLGPLLPVATELGVEMAYPLSENTVLVILQLFCNATSALFIPLFQVVRDVGVTIANNADAQVDDDGAANVLGSGRPPYTFSFYLLILICAVSAVYFATFDGKYLRLEAEQAKKRDDNSSTGPSL
jgi:MFS family permease